MRDAAHIYLTGSGIEGEVNKNDAQALLWHRRLGHVGKTTHP